MKIITANGKSKVKMSQKEWQDIGKKAGWTKTAQVIDEASKENIAQTAAQAMATFVSQYPNSQDQGQFELETVEETLAKLLPINRGVVLTLMNQLSGLITNVRFGKTDISSLQTLTTPQGVMEVINQIVPQQQAEAPDQSVFDQMSPEARMQPGSPGQSF
jgi:hypothetical protein